MSFFAPLGLVLWLRVRKGAKNNAGKRSPTQVRSTWHRASQ